MSLGSVTQSGSGRELVDLLSVSAETRTGVGERQWVSTKCREPLRKTSEIELAEREGTEPY